MVQICCENSVSLKSAESRALSPSELSTTSEPDAAPSTESPQATPESEVALEAEAEPTAEAALESEVVLPGPEPETAILEPEPTPVSMPEPKPECNPEPTTETVEDLELPIVSKSPRRRARN
ncbi:hypothetical protein CSOJ01_15912 [Colletotrichum sojae]|uniref:Uncharacterized protein n=1 Tax=Colletotrichum sojae TaxID=2175907 RepID=A0A8H6ILA7_9PEZI|nr:hypothetical protein CSOJ01_15912 [Colletotrichum sojae]